LDVFGVRDLDAPNGDLIRWSVASRPDPPRDPSRETLRAIQDDSIELLDLCDVRLTQASKARLRELQKVKWLRLPPVMSTNDVAWIAEMRQLRGLSLNYSDLDGVDLGCLSTLESLQWLELDGVRMSDKDFATLPRLKSLQTLIMTGPTVTDGYLRHLASMKLPSLLSLALSHGSVTDTGLHELCSAYDLEYLGLFCVPKVTERSVDSVSSMKRLRVLAVGGSGMCPEYRENETVRRLERLLPDCVIDHGD
jgi:hypothetical protein